MERRSIKQSCSLVFTVTLLLFSMSYLALAREYRGLQVVINEDYPHVYCIANGAAQDQLPAAIDYLCSHGVDCSPIQEGGSCWDPNTTYDHASYVLDANYKSNNYNPAACTLNNWGTVTDSNPSHGSCVF